MNTRQSLLFTLPVLAVGILLLIFNQAITSHGIIIAGGSIFIGAGVLNIVFAIADNRGADRSGGLMLWLGMLVSAAAIVLGICALCMQDRFMPLIPWIFGSLSALGALVLAYLLVMHGRRGDTRSWLYLFPVAMAVMAVLTYCLETPADDTRVMIYTGVALTLYGVCALIGSGMVGVANHKRRKAEEAAAAETAKEDKMHLPKPEDVKPIEDDKDKQ